MCYALSMLKGRPTKRDRELIAKRNKYIIISWEEGHTQSEIAEIFRLPRNTVHTICMKYEAKCHAIKTPPRKVCA